MPILKIQKFTLFSGRQISQNCHSKMINKDSTKTIFFFRIFIIFT